MKQTQTRPILNICILSSYQHAYLGCISMLLLYHTASDDVKHQCLTAQTAIHV